MMNLPKDPVMLVSVLNMKLRDFYPSLEALAPLLPPKAQTLVCGGLEPAEVAALLARAGARGVDRVVPLGQALEMDTVWDGRDLIAALSRIIG